MKLLRFTTSTFDFYFRSHTTLSRIKQNLTIWLGALLLVFAGSALADPVVELDILNATDTNGDIVVVAGEDVEVGFDVTLDSANVLTKKDEIQLVQVVDDLVVSSKARGKGLTGSISLSVPNDTIVQLYVRYVLDGTQNDPSPTVIATAADPNEPGSAPLVAIQEATIEELTARVSTLEGGDIDPLNEVQTLSTDGTTLTLTDVAGVGGGSIPLPQGPAGQDGSQGIQGQTGPQGATGAQGNQGLTGDTGSQGIQGLAGDTGAQGIQGLTGDTGLQGIQGLAGDTGAQGIQGLTGDTGAQGIQGLAGNDGADGATGAQGIQGVAGNDGAAGLVGADGISCTAIQGSGSATISCDDSTMASVYDGVTVAGVSPGDMQYWDGSAWVVILASAVDTTLHSCGGIPQWGPCPFSYSIGDAGPAGGIVFYVTNGGVNGLEAAPVDQSNAAWGCLGSPISGADGTSIGTGAQNTADFIAGCNETGTAAYTTDTYALNGFDDWFLPSKDELNFMYLNIGPGNTTDGNVGGFTDRGYWSSSETSAFYAWNQSFESGSPFSGSNKGFLGKVRAVRAF